MSVRPVHARAADWRYLLASPETEEGRYRRLVIFGGSPALASLASELSLADEIALDDAAPRSADAVVWLHGARTPLRVAAQTVADGGALYAEHGARWRAAQRELETEGLTISGVFAVGPDFDEPRTYLPIESTGARGWFIANHFDLATPTALLSAIGFRVMARWPSFVARWLRHVALTAVRHPPAIAHVRRSRHAAVFSHAALRSAIGSGALQPYMLATGGDRVIVLAFVAHGAEPLAVLKVPRTAAFNERTENEAAQIVALRRALDPDLRDALPVPLTMVRAGRISVSLERAVPGPSLARASGEWGRRFQSRVRDAWGAAAWLTRFHHATLVRRVPWNADGRRLCLTEPIDAYRSTLGAQPDEEMLFDAIARQSGSLTGVDLPIVMQHRDFTVWNIVKRRSSLAVLDWEGARAGLPLTDLLHLFVSWVMVVKRWFGPGAEARAFRALFLAATREPLHDATSVLRVYLDALRIDVRLVPALMLSFALELALRRAAQQHDLGERRSNPREGNRYIALVTLLAVEREMLLRAGEPFARESDGK